MEDSEKKEDNDDCVGSYLDSILEDLGNFGRYQITNCILVFIPLTLCSWYGMSFIFAVNETPHRCVIPECNDNGVIEPIWLQNAVPYKDRQFDRCHRYSPSNNASFENITNITGGHPSVCPCDLFNSNSIIKCQEWVYSDNNSIVSEFNLGCQEWKHTLIGTMNNVGQLFGLPLCGWLSDRFGRRFALAWSIFFCALSGTSRSFSTNYWTYMVFEFTDGLMGAGIYGTGFIIGVELVGPKYRVLASSIISYSYAIGEILLGLLAWLFPYWRLLLRILYVPSLLLISYLWIVPESVRWLLSKGRFKDAEKILIEVAKVNKRKLPEKSLQNLFHSVQLNRNNEEDGESLIKKKENIMYQMVKSRILMVRLASCSIWWMTCTFVYFGMSLNSVSITGNMYLNFVLVCLIEIPGYAVYYFMVDRFGRRLSLCWTLLASGISCFAYIIIPLNIPWLQLCIYLFGKFSITIAFTVLYVYTTELFPTPMRASMLGCCSMFGRFGSIVAPQCPLLSIYMESLPLLLFGGASIFSGIMVLGFPETNKIKLPDTIEEAEQLSKKCETKKNKA